MATQLHAHADQQGYSFPGPVTIAFESAEDLTTGRFRIRSRAQAKVTGNATYTQVGRAKAVLEVNGTRHPLQPPGLVVGRGTDADLRINDPGISRRHAQIRVNPAGPRMQIDIIDLGSTNGILVNGQRVQQAVLQEGSRIEIGSTRMLVHAPAGR